MNNSPAKIFWDSVRSYGWTIHMIFHTPTQPIRHHASHQIKPCLMLTLHVDYVTCQLLQMVLCSPAGSWWCCLSSSKFQFVKTPLATCNAFICPYAFWKDHIAASHGNNLLVRHSPRISWTTIMQHPLQYSSLFSAASWHEDTRLYGQAFQEWFLWQVSSCWVIADHSSCNCSMEKIK